VSLRALLRKAKRPVELDESDLLEQVRKIPEITTWLKADRCRGAQMDTDSEGATTDTVTLLHQCPGERAQGLASITIEKRTGRILGAQAIEISTPRLQGAEERLAELEKNKMSARDAVNKACEFLQK